MTLERTILVVALLGAIPGAPVAAQLPRPFALPDTMGANFAIADSTPGKASASDYDALLGKWKFRFQNRRADGLWNPAFTGMWTFTRRDAENSLIVDHWRPDNAGARPDEGTFTYRAFNKSRGIWEIQGVDVSRGRFDAGLGWSDGANSRYLIQRSGPGVLMRIRYFSITPDHFYWRADQSTDGGKTWLLDKWSMDVTRLSR